MARSAKSTNLKSQFGSTIDQLSLPVLLQRERPLQRYRLLLDGDTRQRDGNDQNKGGTESKKHDTSQSSSTARPPGRHFDLAGIAGKLQDHAEFEAIRGFEGGVVQSMDLHPA